MLISAHLDSRCHHPWLGQVQQAWNPEPGLKWKETFVNSQVGALEIFNDKRVYYKVRSCPITFFQSWNINNQRGFAKKTFRSDITVVCKAMEFGLYPLDNHKCYLILTSCKYGQLQKYCQMIQYFQTSDNTCFIFNIVYIVWSTLQMFLSCDHITMFFHSRIRSTHPHLIHMTYFSLCSQTRFAISWQIKRPPISEYCPYSITISTFDQSSSSFHLFFSWIWLAAYGPCGQMDV